MTDDPVVVEVCREYEGFTLFDDEKEEKDVPVDPRCRYARQYEVYAKDVYQDVLKNPSYITVNEGYLDLFKKYWEWYVAVPLKHRNCIGDRAHHCIYHILKSYYQQLRLIELSLPTPKLYLPPAPIHPPPRLLPDSFVREEHA